MTNENIKAKYNHSFRVMKLSEKYAKKLNFSKEDIEIAKIIGLLHDFGRFEQYKRYHSFVDAETIDHADYSVEILFDKKEIQKFNVPKEYYEIIKFAIQNHNKLHIAKSSDQRKIMHAKLIRDTDKLDIIYMFGYLKDLRLKITSDHITKEVMKSIKNHKMVDLKLCKNPNDFIAAKFAFTFDINNDICLKELKRNLKQFYERINKEEIFNETYLEVMKYIDERIENNA